MNELYVLFIAATWIALICLKVLIHIKDIISGEDDDRTHKFCIVALVLEYASSNLMLTNVFGEFRNDLLIECLMATVSFDINLLGPSTIAYFINRTIDAHTPSSWIESRDHKLKMRRVQLRLFQSEIRRVNDEQEAIIMKLLETESMIAKCESLLNQTKCKDEITLCLFQKQAAENMLLALQLTRAMTNQDESRLKKNEDEIIQDIKALEVPYRKTTHFFLYLI